MGYAAFLPVVAQIRALSGRQFEPVLRKVRQKKVWHLAIPSCGPEEPQFIVIAIEHQVHRVFRGCPANAGTSSALMMWRAVPVVRMVGMILCEIALNVDERGLDLAYFGGLFMMRPS